MHETDCLVIGGGLLGAALAFHLARSGASVRLLEKDQLNRHASGRNAGSLHFQLEYRMIEQGMDAARKAAEALPLHLDAAREWASVEAELGEDIGVRQTGGLMLAETAQQAALLERKAALERSLGLETSVLAGDEVRRLAPSLGPSIVAAAFCPIEGKADPRRATLAFARAAARLGADIVAGVAVTALDRANGRWRAVLSDGRAITARSVAIAAGPWSGRVAAMAGVALPVTPIGLMMTATVRTAPILGHLIQHVGRRLSLKQTPEGTVLIGGGWPARLRQTGGVHDFDRPPEILPDSIRGNMAAAMAVVPGLRQVPVLRVWGGATSLVADGLPLVGAVPRRPDLFIATGGSAFTLGPTYARTIAAMMTGQAVDLDVSRFDPGRFAGLSNA